MKFRKFAATSQGTKYSAKGWACQDFSGALDFGNVQIIAVADGHGGANYFRSEIGSKLAVEILFEQVQIFCKDLNASERLSDTGIKKFKFDFVSEWRNAVQKDWLAHKLGENEIRYESVSEKYKARYTSENVENYLYTAYGTTLICAISIGAQILILQIGDGSCVVLQKSGEFATPVPHDEENFLNVTNSLCDDKAELKIRHAILDCENQNAPAAIFLSTDGLDDCFPYYKNAEHLYEFYGGVLIENMLECGYDATEDEIKTQLLAGLSKKGSQDDISLAYFVPENLENLREIFKQPAEKIVKEFQPEKISAQTVKDFQPEKISTQTVKEFQPEKISAQTVKDFQPEKISTQTVKDFQLEKISAQIVKEFQPEKISTQTVKDFQLEKISTQTVKDFQPPKKILKANEFSMTTPVIIPAKIDEGKAI